MKKHIAPMLLDIANQPDLSTIIPDFCHLFLEFHKRLPFVLIHVVLRQLTSRSSWENQLPLLLKMWPFHCHFCSLINTSTDISPMYQNFYSRLLQGWVFWRPNANRGWQNSGAVKRYWWLLSSCCSHLVAEISMCNTLKVKLVFKYLHFRILGK